MAKPRYETPAAGEPAWASEPFRVFFPFGIAAANFGLILWPLFYAGWWPIYPALQHPRILIFGFGAAFVFGFLGTAWPRFLESTAFSRLEVVLVASGWLAAQIAYGTACISTGDLIAAATGCVMLIILGRRLFGLGRTLPPPGFTLAFIGILLSVVVLFAWGIQMHLSSPKMDQLLRLFGYQGFLLLPLLGVGSYLFPRFFQSGGKPGPGISSRRRALVVWGTGAMVIASFFVEVYLSARWGNALRLTAVLFWSVGVLPALFQGRAPGTRPWALRMGFLMIGVGFFCRIIWPQQLFAFEHLLFLGGFSQLILLVADRVVSGHCLETPPAPKSLRWRWIVWLMILTAATRATADLVPSTRVSHHIYAAIMLIAVLVVWFAEIGPRLRKIPDEER